MRFPLKQPHIWCVTIFRPSHFLALSDSKSQLLHRPSKNSVCSTPEVKHFHLRQLSYSIFARITDTDKQHSHLHSSTSIHQDTLTTNTATMGYAAAPSHHKSKD